MGPWRSAWTAAIGACIGAAVVWAAPGGEEFRWNEEAASVILDRAALSESLGPVLPAWELKQMTWPSEDELRAAQAAPEQAVAEGCVQWLEKLLNPDFLPEGFEQHLVAMQEWSLRRGESEQKRLMDVFLLRFRSGPYVVQVQESPADVLATVAAEGLAEDARSDRKAFVLEVAREVLHENLLAESDADLRTGAYVRRTGGRITRFRWYAPSVRATDEQGKSVVRLDVGGQIGALGVQAETDGRFVRFFIMKCPGAVRNANYDPYVRRFDRTGGEPKPLPPPQWGAEAQSPVLSRAGLAELRKAGLPDWKASQMLWPTAQELRDASVTADEKLVQSCAQWLRKFLRAEVLPDGFEQHLVAMQEWGLRREESEQKRLMDVFLLRFRSGPYVIQVQESPADVMVYVADDSLVDRPASDHRQFVLSVAETLLRDELLPDEDVRPVFVGRVARSQATMTAVQWRVPSAVRRVPEREYVAISLAVGKRVGTTGVRAETDGRFVRFHIRKVLGGCRGPDPYVRRFDTAADEPRPLPPPQWGAEAQSPVLSSAGLAELRNAGLPDWMAREMLWPSDAQLRTARFEPGAGTLADYVTLIKKSVHPHLLPEDFPQHLVPMAQWGAFSKGALKTLDEYKEPMDVFLLRFRRGESVVQVQASQHNVVVTVAHDAAAEEPRSDRVNLVLQLAKEVLHPNVTSRYTAMFLELGPEASPGGAAVQRCFWSPQPADSGGEGTTGGPESPARTPGAVIYVWADTDGRFVRFEIVKCPRGPRDINDLFAGGFSE